MALEVCTVNDVRYNVTCVKALTPRAELGVRFLSGSAGFHHFRCAHA